MKNKSSGCDSDVTLNYTGQSFMCIRHMHPFSFNWRAARIHLSLSLSCARAHKKHIREVNISKARSNMP